LSTLTFKFLTEKVTSIILYILFVMAALKDLKYNIPYLEIVYKNSPLIIVGLTLPLLVLVLFSGNKGKMRKALQLIFSFVLMIVSNEIKSRNIGFVFQGIELMSVDIFHIILSFSILSFSLSIDNEIY
jgi:hypothetical protein